MAPKFDLTGQAFKRNPVPTFSRMRSEAPLLKSRIPILGPVYYATTYEAVTELLKSGDDFSVDARNAGYKTPMGTQWWMPKTIKRLAANMLTEDGAPHRRLRKSVDLTFRKSPIDDYQPRIEAAADALLDTLVASADGDLVANYARVLPLTVICDILGLPQHDRAKFIRWMDALSSVTSRFGIVKMMPSMLQMTRYLKDQFKRHREYPASGLITSLVHPQEDTTPLNDDELLATCFLLFVAGHETTTHMISGSILALLQNRERLENLKKDWSLLPTAIEELLRYVSPVQMTKPRFATRDLKFQGLALEQGEMVIALLASANSDPDAFPLPGKLVFDRDGTRHVAFGNGPHLCLGLHLARAEIQIAIQRLFQRFPDADLKCLASDLRWSQRIGMRDLKSLPMRF